MNKKLFGVIMFAVGAAVGSAVTWKLVKTKYEQIADEEIQSVKEEYTDLVVKMKKHLNETATYVGPQDAGEAASEEDDADYPDDDDRDFTEKEKQQIEYYKLTSKYRGGNADDDEEDEEDDENDEEGDEGKDEFDGEVQYINGPYVITPEDFSCSPPGYNAQTLDYFSDGVLADDWGVKLDVDETIGEENLDHFGEYADDILYIRNERTEIDYEVTKDPRTYDEVVRMNPNPYYGKYEN